MMGKQNEFWFEGELAEHLARNGWEYSKDDTGYDRELALFPADVFGWLEDLPTGGELLDTYLLDVAA